MAAYTRSQKRLIETKPAFPFLCEEKSELFEEANYGSWDQYSIKNQDEMPDDDRLSYELDLCLQEQLWPHLLEAYCCYFSMADLLLSMHKNLNNIDFFKKNLADYLPGKDIGEQCNR